MLTGFGSTAQCGQGGAKAITTATAKAAAGQRGLSALSHQGMSHGGTFFMNMCAWSVSRDTTVAAVAGPVK